jgi:hypothetical protein
VKQIGGRGYYARVTINCQETNEASSIGIEGSDEWHRSEGWIDAALAGVALGLRIAKKNARCVVTRIHGMPCDTNATLVAIAAIRAVWNALGFEPDQALANRVETAILRRSQISIADLERELSSAGKE